MSARAETLISFHYPGGQNAQAVQTPYGPPRANSASRNGYIFSAQPLDDSQRQSRTALQQQQVIQQHMQQLSLGLPQQSGAASSSSLPLQSTSQGSSQANPGLNGGLKESSVNDDHIAPQTCAIFQLLAQAHLMPPTFRSQPMVPVMQVRLGRLGRRHKRLQGTSAQMAMALQQALVLMTSLL